MASRWIRLGSLSCAAALVACAEDTGILVEVTRDSTSTPATIDHLEFVVGVGGPGASRWMRDAQSSTTDVDVSDRDLAVRPFQLLLRDGTGDDPPAQVMVAVFARNDEDRPIAFGGFDEPQPFVRGSVLLRHVVLRGDREVRVTSTGCVSWDGQTIASPDDADCDGDTKDVDCDESNPEVGPSSPETCDNGIDDDCDGMTDEEQDADGDGVSNCDGDCDDGEKSVYPNAPETCDGKDNDCNDVCDDGDLDADRDGYNVCGEKILGDGTCQPAPAPDCDDDNEHVNPGASEACNGVDDDCNGACDDGLDADGDGFTSCGSIPDGCGLVSELADCADGKAGVHPFADELCDGYDTDCDGKKLESQPCYTLDANGNCLVGTRFCDDDKSDGGAGYADACVLPAENVTAPDHLCEAYAACDMAGAEDPWRCANAMSASKKVSCQLFVQGLNLCGLERVVELPGYPGAGCTFSVLGGMAQEHYTVGLSTGDPPAPTVMGCQADFVVLNKRDLLPQPDSVFVQSTDPLASVFTDLWHITIAPVSVAVCPTNGLSCLLAP